MHKMRTSASTVLSSFFSPVCCPQNSWFWPANQTPVEHKNFNRPPSTNNLKRNRCGNFGAIASIIIIIIIMICSHSRLLHFGPAPSCLCTFTKFSSTIFSQSSHFAIVMGLVCVFVCIFGWRRCWWFFCCCVCVWVLIPYFNLTTINRQIAFVCQVESTFSIVLVWVGK